VAKYRQAGSQTIHHRLIELLALFYHRVFHQPDGELFGILEREASGELYNFRGVGTLMIIGIDVYEQETYAVRT
jgi:hypothetical protein